MRAGAGKDALAGLLGPFVERCTYQLASILKRGLLCRLHAGDVTARRGFALRSVLEICHLAPFRIALGVAVIVA